MNIQWLTDLVNKLGPRVLEAWPYVLHMVQDAEKILEVMNGGHPVATAGVNLSTHGEETVHKLISHGIDAHEARGVVQVAEAFQGRF